MEPAWSLVLAALSFAVTLFLSLRSWYYGGAVIDVELDLMERRWMGADMTASVARWNSGDWPQMAKRKGLRLDIVRLTLRNKGRTAATIMDPGLRIGRPPIPTGTWTTMPTRLLSSGETESVVRIESHDAKVFYFLLEPLIRSARDEFGDVPLAARGAITTGTGRTRLSRRWRWMRPGWGWNVLALRPGVDWIGSEPLTLADRLWLWSEITSMVYKPPTAIHPQVVAEAARLAAAGADAATIEAHIDKILAIVVQKDMPTDLTAWKRALSEESVRLYAARYMR